MPSTWAPPGAGGLVSSPESGGSCSVTQTGVGSCSGLYCTTNRSGKVVCHGGCCCEAILNQECVPLDTPGAVPCTKDRFFPQFVDLGNPSSTADSPWTTYWLLDLGQLPEDALVRCVIIQYSNTGSGGLGNVSRLYDDDGEGVEISTDTWEIKWRDDQVKNVRSAGRGTFAFTMTVEFTPPPACDLYSPHAGVVIYCEPNLQ